MELFLRRWQTDIQQSLSHEKYISKLICCQKYFVRFLSTVHIRLLRMKLIFFNQVVVFACVAVWGLTDNCRCGVVHLSLGGTTCKHLHDWPQGGNCMTFCTVLHLHQGENWMTFYVIYYWPQWGNSICLYAVLFQAPGRKLDNLLYHIWLTSTWYNRIIFFMPYYGSPYPWSPMEIILMHTTFCRD